MSMTAKEIEDKFCKKEPELKMVVKEMLRDWRFKKKMLGYTAQIFSVLTKEDKKQMFKEALKEIILQYQIRDINKLYKTITWENRKSKE
jgi:hypothetical protein